MRGNAETQAASTAARLTMERMPGHYIRRLQQVAVRLFMEEAGPELTPVQFASLVAIAQRQGMGKGFGQAELAAQIGYDRATIGGVIDRLEAKGWVSRTASREDRRQNVLAITPAGEQAVAQALPAVEAVQDKFVAPLDAIERAAFERICRKLLEHHVG
ncbi:MAG: transcriptional regulator, MarR family [Hyphomicrobiales bacterium]|jgi:DNA-binding MarR family transcriptional regulator|nr:transcriptional regulator, MarR family [Hyphomicrobiales bacterium]